MSRFHEVCNVFIRAGASWTEALEKARKSCQPYTVADDEVDLGKDPHEWRECPNMFNPTRLEA